MRLLLQWLVGAAFLGAALSMGCAQGMAPGSMGLHPVLTRLFDGFAGFSAKAQVRLESEQPGQDMELPMSFEFLTGNMRAEIRMTEVEGDQVPPQMIASLRQIGMDRIVTIMRKGGGPALILYPNLKASVEVPDPARPPKTAEKAELRETKLGEERVKGVLCDRYRVMVGDQEVQVWKARKMQSFPLRIRIDHGPMTMTVQYEDVTLEPPLAERFKAPSGYKAYPSMQAVMQEAMQRLLQGQPGSP